MDYLNLKQKTNDTIDAYARKYEIPIKNELAVEKTS